MMSKDLHPVTGIEISEEELSVSWLPLSPLINAAIIDEGNDRYRVYTVTPCGHLLNVGSYEDMTAEEVRAEIRNRYDSGNLPTVVVAEDGNEECCGLDEQLAEIWKDNAAQIEKSGLLQRHTEGGDINGLFSEETGA